MDKQRFWQKAVVLCLFGSLLATILVPSAFPEAFGFEAEAIVGVADGSFGGYDTTKGNYTVENNEFDAFYTELSAYVWLFEHVYAGGSSTVQMLSNYKFFENDELIHSMANFNPIFTNYSFEVGVKIGWVTIFWAHDCAHPQTTYAYAYKVTSVWGEGGIDRFGMKASISVGAVGKR